MSAARARTPQPRSPTRNGVCLAALLLAAIAAWPASAAAHGLVGRAYLPVPAWLFAWAAGIVLVLSFIALAALWSTPRFERAREQRLLAVPHFAGLLCGAIGVLAFLAVVISGIAGSQIPTSNLAPTAVFVIFWVAIPIASAVFGDVFRPLNPWRAVARALSALVPSTFRPAPLPYPARLGRWPAVAGVLAFAWVELVFVGRDRPATLAVLAVGYALGQLVGMAFFGIERWSERGDAFGVAFNLFSRLSVLD